MKFIRSSARTNPDPLYYKRKVDRWIDQRNDLLDAACALEEVDDDDREAKMLRLKADRLTAKIQWGHTQLCVSQRMQQQQREKDNR